MADGGVGSARGAGDKAYGEANGGVGSARGAGDKAYDRQGTVGNANDEAERAWRAVYEPVERAIVEEHERRVSSRARRQKEKAEEERRAKGDLLEATEGLSAVWEHETWTCEKMMAWANGSPLILLCLAEVVRKNATRLIDRLRHAERRPTYYEAENARRRALTERTKYNRWRVSQSRGGGRHRVTMRTKLHRSYVGCR